MEQPPESTNQNQDIWQPTISGVYSTKSGYAVSRASKELQEISTPEGFNWIKDIWSSECSPKIKVFMWSIVQKALPLGENLHTVQDAMLSKQQSTFSLNARLL